MAETIKVMVVDDSPFMRRSIERMLTTNDIKVVGTARDGIDTLEKIPMYKPDLITLDIEMPRMDGLTCLKKIMEDYPTMPVLMVSSLTQEGAKATLEALELGALDFISKEKKLEGRDENILNIKDELQEKVRKLSQSPKFRAHRRALTSPAPAASAKPATPAPREPEAAPKPLASKGVQGTIPNSPRAELIVLGCSTGGPKALQDFLPYLPKSLPVPMLIVQHMPSSFTKPFAERLNGICQLEVKEAANGDVPQPGHIYLAPGGIHMHLRHQLGRYMIELNPEPSNTLHRPSVDVLFQSAFDACNNVQLLAIILTGMGSDGAQGMKKLKSKGAHTIAEAESSCVVYGMPKAAFELGCVDVVSPITEMAGVVKNHFQL
ncbi:MAG: chemotaxis response regulator protein-glutamate methylesterase [Holophagales bacterium]|jgi:two-component system chemotaxis response regulator CheB|nr:chemotaxis response regulator protein-glutamate methylesterase [Holophagales bacterium]